MSRGTAKISLLSADLESSKTLTQDNITVDFRIGDQKSLIYVKGRTFKSTESALFDVKDNDILEVYIYPQNSSNDDLVVYGEVKLHALLQFPHTKNHIFLHAAYKEKGVLKQEEAGKIQIQIIHAPKLDSVLEINVESAQLYRDTEAVGKMDPFVQLKIEELTKKTTVKQEAGKSPVWNESFFFIVSNLESKLNFLVQDEDVTTNDQVGSAEVHLRSADILKVSTDWIPRTIQLLFEGKVAGRLSYSTRFTVNFSKKH